MLMTLVTIFFAVGEVKQPISVVRLPDLFAAHEFRSPKISAHPKGYLVCDYPEQKVYCFSKDGELLFQFGEKGEGPGEFSRPQTALVHGDAIFVGDFGNFTISEFDLEGKFIKRFSLGKPFVSFAMANNLFVVRYWHEPNQPDIVIMDREKKVLSEITVKSADDKTYYCTASLSPDNLIYTAPLNKYVVEVYDLDGKFVREFKRDHNPMPYQFWSVIEAEFTTVPISGITFYKDYVFLLHGGHQVNYEGVSGKKVGDEHLNRIDVFDKQGRFVSFFWDQEQPLKQKDLHSSPTFWVDSSGSLWMHDFEDGTRMNRYEIKHTVLE